MNFFDSDEGKWFRKLLDTSFVERPGRPLAMNATVVAQMCSADPKSAQVAMQLLAQQLNEKLKGKPVAEAEDVAGEQRLILGSLFHAYCAVSHVEGNIPLGTVPQEIQFIIEQYPIVLECARFVSEKTHSVASKANENNTNSNIQSTSHENEHRDIDEDRICQFCKKRRGRIEHRISPPMKVVEICICEECSRNVMY